MEVVPGKLGQRGINLPAEKTPNVGNPQKTKYQRKTEDSNNNIL